MSTHIVVVGSTNTDMVVRTAKLPAPGQTVLGGDFFMAGGGKGANQAVAAARLGGKVTFITRVGDDLFGRQSIDQFKTEDIDCSFVQTDPIAPSGIALITVDEKGENCIVVASGANANVSKDDLAAAASPLLTADIILVQLEIPLATVEALLEWSAAHGKRVILNPAPAAALPDSLLRSVSVITPNEKEAEMLTGITVSDQISAGRAAETLAAKGIDTVIITMGRQGSLLLDKGRSSMISAPVVKAVDTTAAGDVFNGALAVALAEGLSMPDAVQFANRAAAWSVTKLGAQTSAPKRNDLNDLYKE